MADRKKDEAALVQRAQRGDRQALDELLTQYSPTIYRFARRLCRDEDSAQEILQDTFLTAVRKLDTFRGDSALGTWFFAVARSACHRRRRRRAGEPAVFEEVPEMHSEEEHGPEASVQRRQMRDAVGAGLQRIPLQLREAVMLRDVEGLAVDEVANVLGISVAAAKSRLHRGRAALAEAVNAMMHRAPKPLAGCPDIVRLFSKRLEGDVGPDLCKRLEEHVDRCPHCKGVCDDLKSALAVCRALPDERVPAQVVDQLRRALTRHLPGTGASVPGL